MKYNAYKVFTLGQHEKEEDWINSMSARGMHLTDVGFCRYTFEKGREGEYIYRLELLDHFPSHPESISYIQFIEDTGAEHVGSIMRWVYFRKKSDAGSFELYSDASSKLTHYKRITLLVNYLTVFLSVYLLPRLGALIKKLLILSSTYGTIDSYSFRQFDSDLYISIIYVGLILFVQIVVWPVRKSIGKLKKDMLLHG